MYILLQKDALIFIFSGLFLNFWEFSVNKVVITNHKNLTTKYWIKNS